ncbi:MAG TPA: ATP-binding protein [Syntrophorhabdales bacterium]|nr:ATP-binding protein [Syntrophorhabdales bacterium]
MKTPDGSVEEGGALADRAQPEPTQAELSRGREDPTRQFAAIVAHSLNNLLTSIIGYTNLVQSNLDETQPNLKSYTEHILHAADRASRLARDLLAFSRRSVTNARVLDLNDVVRTVRALLAHVLKSNIEFLVQLSPSPLPVFADPAALEQVLINLITNAQDAMPQGGCLTVRTGLAQLSRCVVSVSDTGTGIAPDAIDRIFEPFFTTKGATSGTGLGLAISSNIIKQHKGRLTVNSTPGKGTTFEIILPLAHKEAYREKEVEPVVVVGGSETILVAEDEPAVRNLVSLVLREWGYTVIEAADGEDAVRQFADHKGLVDLAILDVVMPKKNGKEVYRDLTRMKPELRALFMSGYIKDVVLERGMLDERVDFIAKPLVPNDLLHRVRQMLDRPR